MSLGPDSHADPGPDDTSVEAEGESLGEAKWNVMKELEPRFPGITADSVRFEVVEEGDGDPACVRGTVDMDAWRAEADGELPDEPAERLRAVVTRVVQALGLRASVSVEESEEEIRAVVSGEDLGLLIGKHGSTIDALQHLAMRAVLRGSEDRKQIVVDAAGYRERRVVHEYLRDRGDVDTHSEGDEPDRHLVVAPVVSG